MKTQPRVLSLSGALQTVLVQSAGPLAQFLTVLLILRWLGASAQGEFAQTKAYLEFCAAVGSLGLGTSIAYVINRMGVNPAPLLRRAIVYCICLVAFFAVTNLILGDLQGDVLPYQDAGGAVALATAGAAGVLIMIARGVYLTRNDGIAFAGSMTVPAVPLLIAVLVINVWAGIPRFDLSALAAFGVSAAIILFLVRQVFFLPSAPQDHLWQLAPLLGNGLHSFLQGVAATFAALASIWLIQAAGGAAADVGAWSSALTFYQAIASPLVMIAPILFNRWSRIDAAASLQESLRMALKVALPGIPVAIALALAVWWALPRVFGAEVAIAAAPAALLALSMPFLIVSRVLAPGLYGSGHAGLLTAISVLRLAGVIGLSAFFLWIVGWPRLLSLAAAWLLADLILAAASYGAAVSLQRAKVSRRPSCQPPAPAPGVQATRAGDDRAR